MAYADTATSEDVKEARKELPCECWNRGISVNAIDGICQRCGGHTRHIHAHEKH